MGVDWELNDAWAALQFPCQVCMAGVDEFCMEPERGENGLAGRDALIAAVCDRRRNRARALRLRARQNQRLLAHEKAHHTQLIETWSTRLHPRSGWRRYFDVAGVGLRITDRDGWMERTKAWREAMTGKKWGA